MTTYTVDTLEETEEVAKHLAKKLKPGCVVALTGALGAGKTTLVKALAGHINGSSREEITSPTFQYLNIYAGSPCVYHFDVWRMQSSEDFLSMGFDEYFFLDGICLIEWADRIQELLPEDAIHIAIKQEQTLRTIMVSTHE